MCAKLLVPLTLVIASCASAPSDRSQNVAPTASLSTMPAKEFIGSCAPWDDWDKPAPPFSIMGNSFYVGTCGISAILITGDDGHILLDSGIPEAGPLILANIRSLGVDPRDIRFILMSHEHFDHVGAHARLAAATRAQIVASEQAAQVLERGVVAEEDPQAAMNHPPFPGVKVDRIVADGEVVKLGNLELAAHTTPGHSPGAMSWTWASCNLPGEPPVCRNVAYVDSLSAVSADDYRFTDHPEVVAAFRDSIDKVRSLPCDYLLTPHPSASQMLKDLRDETFGEPGACQRYADGLSQKLEDRLAKEKSK